MGDLVKAETSMTQVPTPAAGLLETVASRQMEEVRAGVLMAKRFPRDEQDCLAKILKACKRIKLAEQACYAYQRASTQITGPSIRLAEVLAQAWGNIDFGVVEVEQKSTESIMMSYAWDLENNTRQTKTFTVPHVRHSKKYGAKRLTDPRDIYEQTANQAARRLRACILGVIPGDIVEAAVDACEATLKQGAGEPLDERVEKMEKAFKVLGVTKEQLEIRLGHVLETTSEQELVNLRSIYTSISDNFGSVSEFFEGKEGEPSAKATAVRERLAQRRGGSQAPPADEGQVNTPLADAPEWDGPPPTESANADQEDHEEPPEADNPGKSENPGEANNEEKGLLDPLNVKFTEGVHKGKTVKEVLAIKPQYIKFMSERGRNPKIKAACAMALQGKGPTETAPEDEEKQRIIRHIIERGTLIPLSSSEIERYVVECCGEGATLEELTIEQLKAMEEFFSELSNEAPKE